MAEPMMPPQTSSAIIIMLVIERIWLHLAVERVVSTDDGELALLELVVPADTRLLT